MWNRRRDEEPPKPNPQGIAPFGAGAPALNSMEMKKEATPLSNTPVRSFEPETRTGSATIGKSVKDVC